MSRVGVSRRRHLTHSNRFPRQETHPEWAARRADTAANGGIGDTAVAQVFTTAFATNLLTTTGHGFTNTEGPFVLTTDTTLPAGLSLTALYWLIVVDVNTYRLSRGKNAAFENSITSFTDDGTGIHSIQRAATADAITEWTRQKNRPRTIEDLTDIDDL